MYFLHWYRDDITSCVDIPVVNLVQNHVNRLNGKRSILPPSNIIESNNEPNHHGSSAVDV